MMQIQFLTLEIAKVMLLLDELQKKYNHLNAVSITQRDDLIVLEIHNAAGKAEILLLGAQLISFSKHQETQPIIWKSKETFYRETTPVRGGIPIIAPWFGDASLNPQQVQGHIRNLDSAPAHGYVRSAQWTLDSIQEDSQNLTKVTLVLDKDQGDHSHWNAPVSLRVSYTIGEELSIELEVTNKSESETALALALHTYFAISNVQNITIPSFDGVQYYDSLDNWQKKTWQGDVLIDREIDIVLQDVPDKQEIIDNDWQRKILLETQGSASTVLWNPWIEKAKSLSMFGDKEYKDMLCIESANVLDDIKTLAPGSAHTLKLKISTSALV